ncbi:hypothetical protein ACJX0J_027745, partial [Zea mays]
WCDNVDAPLKIDASSLLIATLDPENVKTTNVAIADAGNYGYPMYMFAIDCSAILMGNGIGRVDLNLLSRNLWLMIVIIAAKKYFIASIDDATRYC